MIENQQILAETKDKPNPNFSARTFVWERGVFSYLKNPAKGFSYPFSINNHGEIVGEFRPAHAGFEQLAIMWRSSKSSPIYLDSFLPKNGLWQLHGAKGINDKDEIIGSGVHKGVHSSFVLSIPRTAH